MRLEQNTPAKARTDYPAARDQAGAPSRVKRPRLTQGVLAPLTLTDLPPELLMTIADRMPHRDLEALRQSSRLFKGIADQLIPLRKQRIGEAAAVHIRQLQAAAHREGEAAARETIREACKFLDGLALGDPHIPALARQLLAAAAVTSLNSHELQALYSSCLDSTAKVHANIRHEILEKILARLFIYPTIEHTALPKVFKAAVLDAMYALRSAVFSPPIARASRQYIAQQCHAFANIIVEGYATSSHANRFVPTQPTAEEALLLFESFRQILPHGPRDDQAQHNLLLLASVARGMHDETKNEAMKYIADATRRLELTGASAPGVNGPMH